MPGGFAEPRAERRCVLRRQSSKAEPGERDRSLEVGSVAVADADRQQPLAVSDEEPRTVPQRFVANTGNNLRRCWRRCAFGTDSNPSSTQTLERACKLGL